MTGCDRGRSRSPDLIEQRLRVDQVARVEAFGEPGVERGEEGARGVAFTLIPPEAGEAGGGAQLGRFRLLPARDVEGAQETLFRCRRTVDSRLLTVDCLQDDLPLEPM